MLTTDFEVGVISVSDLKTRCTVANNTPQYQSSYSELKRFVQEHDLKQTDEKGNITFQADVSFLFVNDYLHEQVQVTIHLDETHGRLTIHGSKIAKSYHHDTIYNTLQHGFSNSFGRLVIIALSGSEKLFVVSINSVLPSQSTNVQEGVDSR